MALASHLRVIVICNVILSVVLTVIAVGYVDVYIADTIKVDVVIVKKIRFELE